ncbi:DUF7133 domain-containing protein [Pedobacter metabolipauper]|uniref:Mono/diheme cytochrome c family protein n=1 Tax=Pedobacter metabolipauper TaxID=425513 RepID=A0A4R6T169_9SPHI|nr:c-type cytochrome [Pedobacter metabolipauper]TDQ11348.1 mono/diheme cytochrome c family protein [Pedobacter metabolipauper]
MKLYIYTFLILLVFSLYQCKSYKKAVQKTSATEQPVDFSRSPIVSPQDAIGKMKVEDGFEVQLVAAEPLISTPVAMSFDTKGRIWVVEMTGYMPDTLGRGEDLPSGKIVILTDINGDGVADERNVFLDSLVLPRAICLIDNGIMVAESPNLWFYEINGDKPGKRTLVDAKYAVDGNVEHQPNGLLRALDNWIYNAKSSKRYRKKGSKWIIEDTHFRGQWGISQDNYGRLYYNDNSTNLVGDYFTPGFGATNKNQRNVSGYSERTVQDNRVYPARPTPGINRAYMPGILDDSLRLKNFTAACGPLIYRGALFGADYEFNAFVAEPSANLIKRNILNENGYQVKGKQAYQGKEFLASIDERFRPVSLYDGPDGALYVVDMYRGIIQHKTYATPYLIDQIKKRDLTQPLNCGRIYKIVPKDKKAAALKITDDPKSLVALLGNANGFIRDQAQQYLLDQKNKAAIPYLKEVLSTGSNPLQVIHALWVLEGLNALQTHEVLTLLKNETWSIRMQALSVIPSVINGSSYRSYALALQQDALLNDEKAAPYIAYLTNFIKSYDDNAAKNIQLALISRYRDNNFVADAVISTMPYQEEAFKQSIAKLVPDTNLRINKQLQRAISNYKSTLKNKDPFVLAKQYPKGSALFLSTCQTCHGPDGNGIKSLAPPLNKSEWVTGDKNNLIAIVLFGLTGPVKVNGHIYEAPEISADMPGIAHSEEISDEDIAQLLSYIRASWQNNAGKVDVKDVVGMRTKLKGRQKAFTAEEFK